MTPLQRTDASKKPQVLFASIIVVALAGVLIVQLSARDGGATRLRAPEAEVPAPKSLATIADLEFPCWACPDARSWPLEFRTDLDLLAPLGTGSGNAAEFFVQFRKPDGERFAEAEAMMARRVDGPPGLKKVLPPNDPLLEEAEPWCDQAAMRFYPDYLPYEGLWTALPNLLVPLTFARSWVARGLSSEDADRAMEDFRRAIRLGRLLRQEDRTVIADLVGLACIRAGVEGIYSRAVSEGKTELALIASVVLGEVAPQRLYTAERSTRVELKPFASLDDRDALVVDPPATLIDDAVSIARTDPDRRYRCETMVALSVLRFYGREDQRDRAKSVLEELAQDSDERVAECAQWSLDLKPPEENVREWYGLD